MKGHTHRHLANLTGKGCGLSGLGTCSFHHSALTAIGGRSQPCWRTQTGRLSSSSIFTLIVGCTAGTCNQLHSTSATVETKENCLGLDKKELDVPAPYWHEQRLLNSSLTELGFCQDPRQVVWDCEHMHDSQRMSASKREQ